MNVLNLLRKSAAAIAVLYIGALFTAVHHAGAAEDTIHAIEEPESAITVAAASQHKGVPLPAGNGEAKGTASSLEAAEEKDSDVDTGSSSFAGIVEEPLEEEDVDLPPVAEVSEPAVGAAEETESQAGDTVSYVDVKEPEPELPPRIVDEADSLLPPASLALREPVAPPETFTATKPATIEPLYVRELVLIEPGHNDSNPVWSPDGELIAFERSKRDKKEIFIVRTDGTVVRKIYLQPAENDDQLDFFFPGILEEESSYNAGATWSSSGDRFVFMSNGGSGNYDLYLGNVDSDQTTRLTSDKSKDGLAHWSPVADRLVFVSGRSGKGSVYLMDLRKMKTTRITKGKKSYLYPQWSPDGKKIALIYGSNENHDIYLIDKVKRPFKSIRRLTSWTHDDLRPIWSPDGKKIAFYSNYNTQNDPKLWSLLVVAADGSDPDGGDGLAAKVVATDVIPDVERGPAWMPDSNRLIYVKNARHAYHPLYVVDIKEGTDLPLQTDTSMNHDVTCSIGGLITFRSQVEQWDHVFVAKLKE